MTRQGFKFQRTDGESVLASTKISIGIFKKNELHEVRRGRAVACGFDGWMAVGRVVGVAVTPDKLSAANLGPGDEPPKTELLL